MNPGKAAANTLFTISNALESPLRPRQAPKEAMPLGGSPRRRQKITQPRSCTHLQAAPGAPLASAPPQPQQRRLRRRSGLPRSPIWPPRQLPWRKLWPTMWLAPPAARRRPSRQQPLSWFQRPTGEPAKSLALTLCLNDYPPVRFMTLHPKKLPRHSHPSMRIQADV